MEMFAAAFLATSGWARIAAKSVTPPIFKKTYRFPFATPIQLYFADSGREGISNLHLVTSKMHFHKKRR
jgi:hypothetical protein